MIEPATTAPMFGSAQVKSSVPFTPVMVWDRARIEGVVPVGVGVGDGECGRAPGDGDEMDSACARGTDEARA